MLIIDTQNKNNKIELLWNEYDMNLYVIANYLRLLEFSDIPQFEDIQNRIQELVNDIYNLLGLNVGSGDIIQTKYILTYENNI